MTAETADPTDDVRWGLLRRKINEDALVCALAVFRESEIVPLVIKGWAIGRYYPLDSPRNWVDIDFCVPSSAYENARTLVSSGRLMGAAVDVHRELRHLDHVPWDVVLERAEVADLDGTSVLIPCAEDHLRILAVHWLTDGGARRDRLWDFYHLLTKRHDDFDWERCFADAGPVRSEWLLRVVAITARECGLQTEDLPFASDSRLGIPNWMEIALEKEWSSGVELKPLHLCLSQPGALWAQIKKRLPPNPIHATVDVEGKMDDGARWKYQMRSIFRRIGPALSRISIVLRLRKER